MIGPVIAATLPLMRANAESLMTSRCDVDRLTSAWDETEQKTVTTWAAVHTDVPCHIEEPAITGSVIVTDEALTLETPIVRFPVAFDGVLPNDRVTVADHEAMWVTRAAFDDSTHPVEYVLQCRWTR